jgi:hypothetical protein
MELARRRSSISATADLDVESSLAESRKASWAKFPSIERERARTQFHSTQENRKPGRPHYLSHRHLFDSQQPHTVVPQLPAELFIRRLPLQLLLIPLHSEVAHPPHVSINEALLRNDPHEHRSAVGGEGDVESGSEEIDETGEGEEHVGKAASEGCPCAEHARSAHRAGLPNDNAKKGVLRILREAAGKLGKRRRQEGRGGEEKGDEAVVSVDSRER